MPLDQPASDRFDSVDDISMPLGDHLEELRRRLIWALGGTAAAAVVTFYFGANLIAWLAQPLLQVLDAKGFPPQLLVLEPTAGFTSVYLPVSLIAAAVLASPWILYQVWRFVSVGLYQHERKTVYVLAPFSTIMTVLGVSFTYYILLPVSLLFFFNFATHYPKVELAQPSAVMQLLLRAYDDSPRVSDGPAPAADASALPVLPTVLADPVAPPEGALWINRRDGKLKAVVNGQVRVVGLQSDRLFAPIPQLGEYVRFAAVMILGVCVAFQLPVIMLVAGWTGLFDFRGIVKLRKFAIFFAFALGAVLTPTDLFSMFVLAVPMYLLFELGLVLMRWMQPKHDAPAEL